MNNMLSNRVMMGAAIVGLVGAAGMFIYEQMYAEKRRTMLVREMAKLDRQVATMRTELETLRELQKEANLKRQQRTKKKMQKRDRAAAKTAPTGDQVDAPELSYTSDSEYFTDYQSVIGTDGEMDSEEFYDVNSSEEDDTLQEPHTNILTNGTTNILDNDEEPADKAEDIKPVIIISST